MTQQAPVRGRRQTEPSLSSSVHNRPTLERRQTIKSEISLRRLNPEEESEVEEARRFLSEVKAVSEHIPRSQSVDIGQSGVVSRHTLTKRRKAAALNRTVKALRSLPVQRTPSLQQDLVQVVAVLSVTTDDPQLKQDMKQIIDLVVLSTTLHRAIDAALASGVVLELLTFDQSAWKPEHCSQLLFKDMLLRRPAYRYSRQLLAVWLVNQPTEVCLRDDGPAALLLKCLLRHLDPWRLRFDFPLDDEAKARVFFHQCCHAITQLPRKLLKLLQFIVGAVGMEPGALLSCLLLRHYIPMAATVGLSFESGKLALTFTQHPPGPLLDIWSAVVEALTP